MVKREKSRYTVQSVIHALDILESFSNLEDELGLSELVNKLELHKNNVSKLLGTLERRGYVEQNRITGNYRLGLKTFEMGQIFFHQLGLLKQVRPILEELVAKCNETAYVAILHGNEVVYLDGVETTQSVREVSRIGWRIPAYCTAVGKAQLAYSTREEIDMILKETNLRAYTENTITDVDRLKAALEQVKEQGFALDNSEYEIEIKCVGVPVRDYTHKVVAGICISGPIYRMTEERVQQELITLVKNAGQNISHRLGHDIGLSLEDEG